jgi:hypothetical protein
MLQRIARCALMIAGSTLLTLVLATGKLHADIGGPVEEVSVPRLLAYAGCALSIAAATSGLGAAAAVIACIRILYMTF